MLSTPISTSAAGSAHPRSTFRSNHDWAAAIVALPKYWHLLSLDAPTVAFCWANALALSSQHHLSLTQSTLLALTTWLLYVIDRILDGSSTRNEARLKERHLFHLRHRAPFLKVSCVAALLVLTAGLTFIAPRPLHDYFLLAAASCAYLLLVHLPARRRKVSLPLKEIAVGVIFAVACVIPAWSRAAAPHLPLAVDTALFALLCILNCVAIERWESSHWNGPLIQPPAVALLITAVLACFVARSAPSIAVSILASTALLLLLDRQRHRFSPLQVRILADAVLLTPPVFLSIHHLLFAHAFRI